jgi:hypothetical protein
MSMGVVLMNGRFGVFTMSVAMTVTFGVFVFIAVFVGVGEFDDSVGLFDLSFPFTMSISFG